MNLQDLCFIEKREKQKKEKGLHGHDLAHNEAGPAARIQHRSKKKPTRRGPPGSEYFALGTSIYFENYEDPSTFSFSLASLHMKPRISFYSLPHS